MLRSYGYLRFPTTLPGVIPAQAGTSLVGDADLARHPVGGGLQTAPYLRRQDKRCLTSVR